MQQVKLLRDKELAAELNISVRHVINLRQRRKIPFIRLGKSIRFDPAAVNRALQKLSVTEIG